MQKYGFESYLDSEILPSDFASENCNKVYVDVVEDNSMMMTKVKVVLKDCYNQVLFTSDEGKSRLKEYTAAYNQALREAFASFEKLNHQYNGNVVPQKKEPQVETKVEAKPLNSGASNVGTSLFAQPINNGFQIINAEPKVLYKIYKTSIKDFFIATKGTTQGVSFQETTNGFSNIIKTINYFQKK